MGSGWFIGGLELPEAPMTEQKQVSRSFLKENIYKSFPSIFQPTTTAYNYTLTGYMYGSIVRSMEDLAKSADTEIVTVQVPTTLLKSTELHTGLYAVSSFTIKRDKYMVTSLNNKAVLVYDYTLVLTEFAETGVNEHSLELETLGGEGFIGMLDELNSADDFGFGDITNFLTVLIDIGNIQ